MKTLHIDVLNKIARYRIRDGIIVCGNSDYQIEFSFDSMWDEYTEKTARFIWNNQYFDVTFSGNTCNVPVITDADVVTVGVYTGDIRTTTGATINCQRSILCGGEAPNPGTGQHYTTEAQQAAQKAENMASTAQYFASQSSSKARDASSSAASAAESAAEVAEVKVAALAAAKQEPKIAHNSIRIEKIEDKLGLDSDIVKIESGYKNGGYFDANMYRYIRILKLGSNGATDYLSDNNEYVHSNSYLTKVNGISVTPNHCPDYGVWKSDDERYSNYVFFENGKAYYHQGCRLSTEDNRQDGEIYLERNDASYGVYIISLAEPIITDISEYWDFDGVIDLGELNNYTDGSIGDYGEGNIGFTGNGYIEFAYMTKEEA